jgi:hypothetical protein
MEEQKNLKAACGTAPEQRPNSFARGILTHFYETTWNRVNTPNLYLVINEPGNTGTKGNMVILLLKEYLCNIKGTFRYHYRR